jgi:TusA-related sulfurtransferase
MKTNKIPIPELKKTLRNYKNHELIKIIIDCYKTSDEVKKYVGHMLDPETTVKQLFEETKKIMVQEFYPSRGGPKLRLARAKKAISDFNKLCNDLIKTLDLMIYYVELGVDFTNDYGDIDERFYISMETVYENVLNKIRASEEDRLFMKFKERLEDIVKNTDGIGWGFHDQLAGLYYEIESEYEEEQS